MRIHPLCLTGVVALAVSCAEKSQPAATQTAPATAANPGEPAAAGKKGYEGMATVAGAGVITGAVTYAGDMKDATNTITKDQEVCGGQTAPQGALVVNGGKLKNAVVYIDKIDKGKAFEPAEVKIDNVKCAFVPRVSVAHVGSKVTTVSSDPVLHNTHLREQAGNKNLWNVPLPQPGQAATWERTLKKTGVVDIKCDAHEWMQGFAYVTEHPYATVTGDDGSFRLADVPPGDYTLKVWHEKLGEKEAKVTVGPGVTATADFAL